MRSRAIFCSYIAQNMAQIKALFKEQWESLVGLCDEFLYLGGNEKETHKYVSELMGKETLDTNTYGHSRGRSGSFSVNDPNRRAGNCSPLMRCGCWTTARRFVRPWGAPPCWTISTT